MKERRWISLYSELREVPKDAHEVRVYAGFFMLQRDQASLKELRSFVDEEWPDEVEKHYLLDPLNCEIDYTDFLAGQIVALKQENKQQIKILILILVIGIPLMAVLLK